MRGSKESLCLIGGGGGNGGSSAAVNGGIVSSSNNGGGAIVSSGDRIKKASYYVWFLGACECRGLRGSDVVSAVIGKLLGRERDHEPEKVTLQVSAKGIKLLQLQDAGGAGNVGLGGLGGIVDGGFGGTKPLIPAAALTYVQQEAAPNDDLVTAVLLIYNPATRCPVHVHAYRCDSPDTASMLKDHLMLLIQRPQQQSKLAALETRLTSRGLLGRNRQSEGGLGSSGSSANSGSSGSGGGGSGSGGGGHNNCGGGGASLAALYDSLAAELREKLGNGCTSSGGGGNAVASAPMLLPPRDYNHRQEDDSARSSGIGSDDATPPSPDQTPHVVRPSLHRQPSSSDDEWAGDGGHHNQSGTAWNNSHSNSHNFHNSSFNNSHNSNNNFHNNNPMSVSRRYRSPSPLTRRHSKNMDSPYSETFRESSSKRDASCREYHQKESSSYSRGGVVDLHRKESVRDISKEPFRDSHKDMYRESHRPERDGHKEHFRSNSGLAARRRASPLRNLSPIRLGPQRKVPPALKHTPIHQNRERSESPVSPRERFQDARDKFLSLERVEWRSGKVRPSAAAAANGGGQELRSRRSKEDSSAHRSSRRDNRDDLAWLKSDRETGYGGTKDVSLVREKRYSREYDRGYGTCDTRDSDHWKKEMERRSPDYLESKYPDRSLSPTNIDNRNYRMPRVRSPDRSDHPQRNEYQRAKSMHDLSRQRSVHDDDSKDYRRRSLYDTLDSPQLQKSRSQQCPNQHYHSYGNLGPVRSSTPSSCSSGQSIQGYELPDSQRYPGLDRSTARNDPPIATPPRYAGFNKKTFDYPVNGGHAPIHISRAHHDDYRRFRYDHSSQFARSPPIPMAQY